MTAPTDEKELAEAIRSAEVIRTGSILRHFSVAPGNSNVELTSYTGIVDFAPNDQVVTIRSGSKLKAIQEELAEVGQCIPHDWPLEGDLGEASIGTLIDFNLPHRMEAQRGT